MATYKQLIELNKKRKKDNSAIEVSNNEALSESGSASIENTNNSSSRFNTLLSQSRALRTKERETEQADNAESNNARLNAWFSDAQKAFTSADSYLSNTTYSDMLNKSDTVTKALNSINTQSVWVEQYLKKYEGTEDGEPLVNAFKEYKNILNNFQSKADLQQEYAESFNDENEYNNALREAKYANYSYDDLQNELNNFDENSEDYKWLADKSNEVASREESQKELEPLQEELDSLEAEYKDLLKSSEEEHTPSEREKINERLDYIEKTRPTLQKEVEDKKRQVNAKTSEEEESKYNNAMLEKYGDYSYEQLFAEAKKFDDNSNESNWLKNAGYEKATSEDLQSEYDKLTDEYNSLYDSRDEETSYNRLKEIEQIQGELENQISKKKQEERVAEFNNLDEETRNIISAKGNINYWSPINWFGGDENTRETEENFNNLDMSEEEKSRYLETYKRIVEIENAEQHQDAIQKQAENNPTLASLVSIGNNTFGAITDKVRYAGAALSDDGYINPRTTNVSKAQTARTAVSENMNDTGSFLYNTGMSMADFTALLPLNLIPGGQAGSLAIMGTSAGVSSANTVIENGGDLNSAISTGLAAGIAESFFEKFSLGELKALKASGADSVKKAILKNAFVEGSEEVGTDIANAITDQIINGDMSQLSQQYQNYIKLGYNEDEAWKMCAVDFGTQVGQSFLGGAISGGVLGGGAIGINYATNKAEGSVVNKQVGKAVKESENVNSLIETAKKLSSESKAYKVAVQLEEQQKNNKKVSSSKVGQLRSLIIEQSQTEFDTEYKKATENLHEDEKAVVDKLLNREALSEDEVKILNDNDVLKNSIADVQKKFNNLYSSTETANKAPFKSIKSIDDNTDKINETKLKVSEDGKTKVNDEVYDGAMEVVRTNPFAETVTYKMEKNGEVIEVNSDNIEFRTKEEAKLNALASKYNVQTAQKFFDLYESGQDVDEYSREFNIFQNYGRLAVPLDSEKLNVGYLLNNDQKMGAYEAGLTSRKSYYQEQNIISSNAKNSKYYAYTKGNFNASAIKGIQLDETQRAFYNFFREFALRTGINVELFSSKEISGKYQGEQGSWNKNTKTIRIDINAGLKNVSDRKEIKHGMLNTFSHELTHIAELSGFYDELHEAIVSALEKRGTDFNELVKAKKDELVNSTPNAKVMSDEKLTYLADVEVIAECCETMLKNSKIFEDIAQGNPTLAQKIKDKLKNFIARLKQLLNKTSALTPEGKLLEECVTEFENINRIWDKAVTDGIKTANAIQAEQKNNTADNSDVRNQSRNIVQSEFEKNVDAIEKNTYNSNNVVIMGVTPDILQKIGLTPLPLAMTKNHIYSIAVSNARAKKEGRYRKNTNYHDLGFDTVKDIYDKISNPLMIIAHPDFTNKVSRDSTHKIIVLVDLSVNGEQIIAPIEMDFNAKYNNNFIDVNLVSTYFNKKNIGDLIKEAVALETNNKKGFFYVDKKRTQSIFEKSGYQLPRILNNSSSDIIIRKIDDNVNKKINKITQSQQFIRWFGDWQNHPETASKVVDSNGEPLVVYHQTEKSFTAFDTKQKGSGKFDSEMPTGIFMKPTNTDIGVGGNIQMPLYANIKNPLVVNNRSQLVDFYNKNVQGYIEAKTSINDIDSEYKGKFQEEMKRENEEYQKLWIAQKNGEITEEEYQKSISRDALDDILEEWNNKVNEASLKAKSLIDNYFENSKYDGVIVNNDTGSFGRSTKTIIAFNNTQVKSATDNIGTFDSNNPDIRYQSRNTEADIDENIEDLLFDEEFYKPFENEDKTVITESLSELQSKLENMNDDNSTWDEQFAIRTKIKALREGYKSPYDYFVGKQKKNILKDYEYDPEKYKEKFKKKLEKKAKEESLKNDIANTTPLKRAQYYIIQKTNPMWDDYHLGIRSPKDIKTFQEVVDEGEGFEWGDFDLDDAKKALKKGTIRVYSSYAIKNGTFVSTSYQQALQYAGMNPQNVHSRVVALDSVAWINGDEGQYAKVYKSDLDDSKHSDLLFQMRPDNGFANRRLLANALEKSVQNNYEKNKVKLYKENIDQIEELEARLDEVNEKIKKATSVKAAERNREQRTELMKLNNVKKILQDKIVRKDKQLLNFESMESMKKLIESEKKKARHEARINYEAKLKEKNEKHNAELASVKERDRERLAKVRESKDKIIVAEREKRKTMVKGIRNARDKKEIIRKIKKKLKDIDKLLNRSKADKTVKQGLIDTASKLLSLKDILFDTNLSNADIVRRGVETATPEEQKLLKEYLSIIGDTDTELSEAQRRKVYQLNSKLKDLFIRERERLNRATVKQALTELSETYKSVENAPEAYLRNSFDKNIIEAIDNFKEEIGGTLVKDMNVEQVQKLHDIVTMILTSIRNANKLFAEDTKLTCEETSNNVMNEILSVKGTKEIRNLLANKILDFQWRNLKPIYAFRLMGSKTFEKIYWNLQKGELDWYIDLAEAKQFKEECEEKYGYKSFDFKKTFEFTAMDGSTFTLDLNQMMDIYAASRRPQALQHLLKGGFTFEKDSADGKLKVKTGAKAYPLTMSTIQSIANGLSENEKGYAEAMQKYLSEVMATKGNEVSMALYGVEMFNEDTYWSISSSDTFLKVEENETTGEFKVKYSPFTKSTIRNASNPIVLRGFEESWCNHVNQMSLYHALTLPLEDFTKVFNYNTGVRTSEENPTAVTGVRSVIKGAFGNAAEHYFRQFMRDLNGGIREASRVGIADNMIALSKKAAVFANFSVFLQQPSAIFRAWAYVDKRYFLPEPNKLVRLQNHHKDWEQLKKYAPIAGIKEMGMFDTGTGKGVLEWLSSDKRDSIVKKTQNKIDGVGSWFPAKADEYAWIKLWHAIQRETRAKYGLAIGTEENLVKSGERFNEVVHLTQVYDSVFSRSGAMRSSQTFDKMATSFMAEPTTIMNMAVDAVVQLKRNGKSGIKQFAKSVSSILVSIFANTLLKSIITAGRDDDEDETYGDKYLQAFCTDLINSAIPLNYYPIMRDLVSVIEGYTTERMDMSLVSDFVVSLKKLLKEDGATANNIVNFVSYIANLFGLPMRNVVRDFNAVINTYKTLTTASKDPITSLEMSMPTDYQEAYDKYWQEGYEEKDCESKAASSVKAKIRKKLRPVYLEALKNQDSATVANIRRYMRDSGFYNSLNDVDEVLKGWRKSSDEEEERAQRAEERK